MTDPLRKAAEDLLADARKPRKHARLGDIPVSAGLLHILEISLLQRGEEPRAAAPLRWPTGGSVVTYMTVPTPPTTEAER